MPWSPEIEFAKAEVDRERRSTPRLGFFEGIQTRSAEELAQSFDGEPSVDDPRFGRVAGQAGFDAYVHKTREWLRQISAGIAPVRLTMIGGRSVEELSVKLTGDHPELPVAVVSDLSGGGRILAIRVYHSTWPVTGGHVVRPPLLAEDPSIELTGAPATYQRGLAAGDKNQVVSAFEPTGLVREPAGGPYTYVGDEHHRIYDIMFANAGGIPLQFCSVTDDGVACAIEYNCVRWGQDDIPAQAGVAVYERGASGLLAAARIYDDVTPPSSSDSSH